MFKQRSYQKELLDENIISSNLLYQNLKELEVINKYLGGHSVSLKGLKKVMVDGSKTYNIIDIGCGGGDSLKTIAQWSKKKKYGINLTGVDLKQDCINYAQHNCKEYTEIEFRCDDFRNVFTQENQIDIVHAALFCHHFTEDEVIEFIKLCSNNKATFVINDLERNPIAYYSIKFLTSFFSKSPLVKNDAPLSVLRGFKKVEWKSILEKAGIKKYIVKNWWAFRHLIIAYPNELGNEIIKIEYSSKLHLIQLPVLCITGKYDFTVPMGMADEVMAKISSAKKKLFKLEHSGHICMENEPDKFYQEVIKFIEENK